MPNIANDPKKKSWIEVPENSDFPIQNIPFGVFITKEDVITIGTRIGNCAIDMGALQQLGYFEGIDFNNSDLIREVSSTYIHFPLLLKFSAKRFNNIKPFVVGGFSAALNLSSNEENPDDNAVGQFRTKRGMLFYELGIGIDLYLFYFKFTPSIRGVFAINDELIRDNDDANSPWTSNVHSMKTRGLFINFTFQ